MYNRYMVATWKIWSMTDPHARPLYESADKTEMRRVWLMLRNSGELVELESPDGDTWRDPKTEDLTPLE